MRKLIGEILTARGFVAPSRVEEAFNQQGKGDTRRIGEILTASGAVTPEQVGIALAEQAGVSLSEKDITARQDVTLLNRFPIFLARRFNAIPLFVEGDTLVVAAAVPDDRFLLNQLFLIYGLDVLSLIHI